MKLGHHKQETYILKGNQMN